MQSVIHAARVCPRGPRRGAGFTLIELMVVMAIVGILSAIAYPSYMAYVVRTNRTAAKSCMTEVAQFMERFYTTRLTYVGAAPVLGCQSAGGLGNNYTLSVADLAERAYTVTATPINAQATRDTQCGILTLDEQSARGESGTADLERCWSR